MKHEERFWGRASERCWLCGRTAPSPADAVRCRICGKWLACADTVRCGAAAAQRRRLASTEGMVVYVLGEMDCETCGSPVSCPFCSVHRTHPTQFANSPHPGPWCERCRSRTVVALTALL